LARLPWIKPPAPEPADAGHLAKPRAPASSQDPQDRVEQKLPEIKALVSETGLEPPLAWYGNEFGEDPQYHEGGLPAVGSDTPSSDAAATAALEFTGQGNVKRHKWRGDDGPDAREQKRAADTQAWAGMRDPSHLHDRWPRLWETMGWVTPILLRARTQHPELAGLHRTFGSKPAREPPKPELIGELRREVAKAFGLRADAAEQHHWASPWRYRLVKEVQRWSQDPDTAICDWLSSGAPMGVTAPIAPGNGAFPLQEAAASLTPQEVLREEVVGNHASFEAPVGFDSPPGYDIVTDHVNSGFGMLFKDRRAAEEHLQSAVATAPLGCVSKQKEDKSWKHRVIMDLKMNSVNQASSIPERQVLPTCFQHGLDLALLAAQRAEEGKPGTEVITMILDLKDAFMGIPLDRREYPYNACELKRPISRTRGPLFQGEASSGSVVVWAVLGFGGKANPLVFARCAAFACRTAQAMLKPHAGAKGCDSAGVCRMQMYVDDPTAACLGTAAETSTAIDLIMLWWMVLGLPLSLPKGVYTSQGHTWIGAVYSTRLTPRGWAAVVRILDSFAEELYELLEEFSTKYGHVSKSTVERVLGKAGRLAYVVPPARPFVSALWGAFGAARDAAQRGKREAPSRALRRKQVQESRDLAAGPSQTTDRRTFAAARASHPDLLGAYRPPRGHGQV